MMVSQKEVLHRCQTMNEKNRRNRNAPPIRDRLDIPVQSVMTYSCPELISGANALKLSGFDIGPGCRELTGKLNSSYTN
jgi:hypothetical protein